MGSGQPLIILHGVFGSLDNWMTLGRKFSEKFEVYLLDQRNHGKSPHSDEFSYAVMAEDLKGFITSHKLENPIVIGHSMGGKAAMKFAVENAGMLEKLIVADMAPKPYEVHHQPLIDAMKKLDLSALKSRRDADNELKKDIPDFGVRQFLLKNLYRKEKDKFDWRFNLQVIEREMVNISGDVKMDGSFDKPTLFIAGGKSPYVKESDHSLIKKYFPNAEIKTIEKAGHWVHANAPDAFYKLVMDFSKG